MMTDREGEEFAVHLVNVMTRAVKDDIGVSVPANVLINALGMLMVDAFIRTEGLTGPERLDGFDRFICHMRKALTDWQLN
jgi:hypothetical protein